MKLEDPAVRRVVVDDQNALAFQTVGVESSDSRIHPFHLYREFELRPTARLGAHRDIAAQHLDKALGYSETEARSPIAARG